MRRGVLLETKDLLRKADNRIPHNFHQLITDEEVDYLLSYAPIVDIGEEEANKAVTAALGDNFLKISRTLDVEACNSGCAWLHYWVDVTKKSLVYASVPSDQIIPIMADSLEHKMDKLIRYYMITKTEGATKKKLHSRRIVGQLEMRVFSTARRSKQCISPPVADRGMRNAVSHVRTHSFYRFPQ